MALLDIMTLVVALLCSSHQASAGGSLGLYTFYYPSYVPSGDDTYSPSISTKGSFPFGRRSVDKVYVSTNGYFSMGKKPQDGFGISNIPDLSSSQSIVAPFVADISTNYGGVVKYVNFSSDYPMDAVNYFIRNQLQSGDGFYGTRMMLAEWSNVPLYSGDFSYRNTFQGILITNGSASFAVFIYKCGGMDWGGGLIGWQASTSHYDSYYLSGYDDNNEIGCMFSFTSSAIVFKVSEPCDSGQFLCDNEACVPNDNKCDGHDQCGDNSDESGCLNIGFVVGATVGGFFILLLPGVIVCTLILVACVRTRRRRTIVRTTAVSTEPLPVDTDSHRAPLLPSHDSQTAKLQHQPKQTPPQIHSNPAAGYVSQPYLTQNKTDSAYPPASGSFPNQSKPPPLGSMEPNSGARLN